MVGVITPNQGFICGGHVRECRLATFSLSCWRPKPDHMQMLAPQSKKNSKSQGDESRRSLDISSPQGSSKRKIENGFTVRLMYKESQESLSFCMILNLAIEP